MLLFAMATLAIEIVQCIITISVEDVKSEFIEHNQLYIINIVTLVLCIIVLIFVVMLLCYHSWLIRKNLSTF